MNSEIMFYILAGMILIFSVMTVTSRRILRAAVYLLFVLISTAGLYFMLSYSFLAAVQLTVYAGGIVVLIIFSILLTSHISERAVVADIKQTLLSALAAVAGAVLTLMTILRFTFVPTTQPATGTSVKDIGTALISYGENGYALPFEVISILLLAAMIGAIIVARKEKLKGEN
ncbi:MAG: NADH-quinone oxidoreductase subunit J [Bacteroidales bacterium]|nr:NADH-quinone oxidoreductase subunit J [Bacteroidales bacterium]MBK7174139.1 NADH-quinone oxidoreductase subunit J [Bacteroidales bacterium]